MDEDWARANGIDTSVVHPARRYNYLLGGADNFQADRDSGDLLERVSGSARVTARENRAFLQRAVRFLAESGIDQFLDIGTGLPTADNTHEVAQRVNPRSRVAYIDNDPLVLVHARALLAGAPEGRTCYVEADLRRPGEILAHPEVVGVLDFDRPVALVLSAVLHFIEDDAEAGDVVRRLRDALPAGSCLILSHMSVDFVPPEAAAAYRALVDAGEVDAYSRSREQIAEFFRGFDLLEPGIVSISDWRSARSADQRPAAVAAYGAVGRSRS
ncbi:SAM-dependent methyltransferase [Actinoplanes sp. NPDC051494]|uniref:SAM-dependent methyltransferase n=1 Tax=Actinoplanes sp. NPDC051494 TaxID=3363907 RepID=UPI0037ABA195